jgi:hypothetical protein
MSKKKIRWTTADYKNLRVCSEQQVRDGRMVAGWIGCDISGSHRRILTGFYLTRSEAWEALRLRVQQIKAG